MTRSCSPRKPKVCGSVVALLTAATCLGTVHAAETEEVVFAAENALYGAGYEIGRADGWLDEQLREAIRAYQTENELDITGNLNTATLKALGISRITSATITSNAVGSRKESVTELGLSFPEQVPRTQTVARTEPKSLPQPGPTPTPDSVQQSPEPIKKAPTTDAQSAKKQEIAEEISKQPEVEAVKDNAVAVAVAEAAASEPVASEPPAPDPTPEPEIVARVTAETTEEPDPVLAQIPEEPTSAGNAEVKTTDTKNPQPEQDVTIAPKGSEVADNPRSTGGGFFSTLFDFFFGWLV